MIKDFKKGELIKNITYELVFDDGHHNGYGFPCDQDGKVTFDNDSAKENYEWCLTHKDQFVRAGVVIKEENEYREDNSGVCHCGNRIDLYNEYMGSCECPHCGQWWNLFGQALLPPSQWGCEAY